MHGDRMVGMQAAGTGDAVLGEPALTGPVLVGLVVACAASVAVAARIVGRLRRGLPAVEPWPHPPATWGGGDVAMIVLVYLALVAAAGLFLDERSSLRVQLAADVVTRTAAMLAGIALLRSGGASWAALGFGGGRWHENLRLAVGGLALVLAPLLGIAAFLDRIVPYEHRIIDFLSQGRDPVGVGLVVLAAVVVAPLAEEFFFRRVLQGWLEVRLPEGDGAAAVGLSAAAFAAAHAGQGLAPVPLFLLGIVLGVVAHRTGTLAPCVLLHSLFNAVSVGLILAAPAQAAAGGA
ncbi:MAG: lysostaphin resistance A-like protein [Planctomycetaceae bacterium]